MASTLVDIGGDVGDVGKRSVGEGPVALPTDGPRALDGPRSQREETKTGDASGNGDGDGGMVTMQTLQEENRELHAMLEEERDLLEQLIRSVDGLKVEKARLEKQVEGKNKSLQETKNENDNLRKLLANEPGMMEDAINRFEALESKSAGVEEQLRRTQVDLEEARGTLREFFFFKEFLDERIPVEGGGNDVLAQQLGDCTKLIEKGEQARALYNENLSLLDRVRELELKLREKGVTLEEMPLNEDTVNPQDQQALLEQALATVAQLQEEKGQLEEGVKDRKVLAETLSAMTATTSSIRDRLMNSNHELEEYKTNFVRLQKEKQRIEEEFELDRQEYIAHCDVLRADAEKGRRQQREARALLEKARATVAHLQGERARLREDMAKAHRSLAKAELQVESTAGQEPELRKIVESMRNETARLNEENAKLRSGALASGTGVDQDTLELVKSLEERNEALQQNQDDQGTIIQELRQTVVSLLADRERDRGVIRELTGSNATLEEETASLVAELKMKGRDREDAGEKIKSLHEEIRLLRLQQNADHKMLKDARDIITRLQAEGRANVVSHMEDTKLRENMQNLLRESDRLRLELGLLKEREGGADEEKHGMVERLTALMAENRDLHERVASLPHLEKEVERLQRDTETLRADRDRIMHDIMVSEQEVGGGRRESRMASLVETLNRENETLRNTSEEAQTNIRAMEHRVGELQSEISALTVENQSLKRQGPVGAVGKMHEGENQLLKQAREAVNRLREENRRLEERLAGGGIDPASILPAAMRRASSPPPQVRSPPISSPSPPPRLQERPQATSPPPLRRQATPPISSPSPPPPQQVPPSYQDPEIPPPLPRRSSSPAVKRASSTHLMRKGSLPLTPPVETEAGGIGMDGAQRPPFPVRRPSGTGGDTSVPNLNPAVDYTTTGGGMRVEGVPDVGAPLTVSMEQDVPCKFQWFRDLSGLMTEIPGASEKTYTPTAQDIGAHLQVLITPTNEAGQSVGPPQAIDVPDAVNLANETNEWLSSVLQDGEVSFEVAIQDVPGDPKTLGRKTMILTTRKLTVLEGKRVVFDERLSKGVKVMFRPTDPRRFNILINNKKIMCIALDDMDRNLVALVIQRFGDISERKPSFKKAATLVRRVSGLVPKQ